MITTCGRMLPAPQGQCESSVCADQKVGVKQTDDHIWLVIFMGYDLGYFDDETLVFRTWSCDSPRSGSWSHPRASVSTDGRVIACVVPGLGAGLLVSRTAGIPIFSG